MKAKETKSSNENMVGSSQTHGAQFTKVLDGRKQPVRGLCVRNGRFYARLAVENPVTGVKKTKRVPLVDKDGQAVATVAQARDELKRLQTKRADNDLPVLARTSKFADYVTTYLKDIGEGQGAKKPGTREKEKTQLARWVDAVGRLRLDQIKRVHVNNFITERLKAFASPRTINLDVIAFRLVMKRALEDGIIQRLPTDGLRPLKSTAKKRPLFTSADLEKLCAAAFETKLDKKAKQVLVTENAQEFADYVKLMAYSGARRNEALGIRWEDCDTDNGQLHLRRQVTHRGIEDLKNREQRVVDFNPKLRAHLADMKARSGDVSDWLFPSPQRGDKDIPAKSFRQSLVMAREKAELPTVGYHDCRHHFISMCVMSGIDFMTIAAWVGHRDGGVLIGKVYGHLANEHRKAMAERVSFEPTVLPEAANA